jgi:hypothetical protein
MTMTTTRSIGESITYIQAPAEEPMTPMAASRALTLLARWMVRRARKLASARGGDVDPALVTGVLSNGYRLNVGQN